MADARALATAFDLALRQVNRALAGDLRTSSGDPAGPRLERLHTELTEQRAVALRAGSVDADWVRRVVRDVAAWTPESELALIAALGQIARAGRRGEEPQPR